MSASLDHVILSMSNTCERCCSSTWRTTMVGGLIAHSASRPPSDRLFGLPRHGQAGSSLDQCWLVCTTNTIGWPLDLQRDGWNIGTPQHGYSLSRGFSWSSQSKELRYFYRLSLGAGVAA